MTDYADFIDSALKREGSSERAAFEQSNTSTDLGFYGASVGAVRGAVRDARRRYRHLSRDEVTALSSELWAVPVFERRLAAIVVLQSIVRLLDNSDLTRIEGFIRTATTHSLVDPLAADVVAPMLDGLDGRAAARARSTIDRWARDNDALVRRAATVVVATRAPGE
jgi:hypothetical protein